MASDGAKSEAVKAWGMVTVGLSLVLCATPYANATPARAAGDGPYRVQMISRLTKSNAPFTISINASADNDFGVWRLVELRRDGRRWKEGPASEYHGIVGSAGPTVYDGSTTPVSACPDGPTCHYPVTFDGSRQITTTPTATSRYYIASAYAKVNIVLNTKGWRVSDVPNPGVRRVLAERATATGARAVGRAVEHFTSAAAPGGKYGSSVFASVACDERGTGSARLTAHGAVEPGTLQCSPTTRAGGYWYTYSPVKTVWHLDGDVIGVGSSPDRLFVFDYPKP